LTDKPDTQLRLPHRIGDTEALAFKLCALIFCRGKSNGRYAIEMEELPEATGLSLSELYSALELAVERAWLDRAGLLLALKAAGIHIAKMALDLPR
jgi:hypothetical protein